MKKISILISILALAFFCSVRIISAQGIRINVPGDHPTINAAIKAAKEGDTVLVSDGTYNENIKIYSKSIILASHFILDGNENHISNTIIDGSNPVYTDSASVITVRNCPGSGPLIKGFTITKGEGTRTDPISKAGGGILVLPSGATIENNIITQNALTNLAGDVYGGGISAGKKSSDMHVVIRNNKITDNHILGIDMVEGGGIMVGGEEGLILIENNDISDNSATCTGYFKAMGGGIGVGTEEPWTISFIIRNNRIANNAAYCEASFGGGIYISFPPGGDYDAWGGRAPFEIYNNLIVDNYSEDKAGGISLWTFSGRMVDVADPNPIIFNNTIVNNTAQEGGAFFNYDVKPLLFNNIMWNNAGEGPTCEIFMEDIHYLIDPWINSGEVLCRYNIIKGGYTGEGNISDAPSWCLNSYDPDSHSKCIGSGIDYVTINRIRYDTPSTDYYGNPRPNPVDEYVDMGAIESSFMLTGIESPTSNSFQLFPNPANDHVILLANRYGKYTLELYTSNGQMVSKRDFTGTSCTVDLADCRSGMYILLVRTQGKVWTGKIVRQ